MPEMGHNSAGAEAIDGFVEDTLVELAERFGNHGIQLNAIRKRVLQAVIREAVGQQMPRQPPTYSRDPETGEMDCPHTYQDGTSAWVYTGTAYGGDDDRWHGEGRVYCALCNEDGDG